MRIIGGELRGARLKTPKGKAVRPTSDMVREALFDRLEHLLGSRGGFRGKGVLDLFAGTGALGIEALSRGASSASFVEFNAKAREILRYNLERLSLRERAVVLGLDLAKGQASWRCLKGHGPFDIVLADPPYGKGYGAMVVKRVHEMDLVPLGGILVLEEEKGRGPKGEPPGWKALGPRRYGRTELYFFEKI